MLLQYCGKGIITIITIAGSCFDIAEAQFEYQSRTVEVLLRCCWILLVHFWGTVGILSEYCRDCVGALSRVCLKHCSVIAWYCWNTNTIMLVLLNFFFWGGGGGGGYC